MRDHLRLILMAGILFLLVSGTALADRAVMDPEKVRISDGRFIYEFEGTTGKPE